MNDARHSPGFLGRGWSFPPTFDLSGAGVAMVEGAEDIRQSVRLIFTITPGQRQMMPQFGCDLMRFAFRTLDVTTVTKIRAQISTALLRYEPRIIVDDVMVTPSREPGQRAILIAVNYTIRASNRRDNFVFPYVLEEAVGIPA